MRGRIPRPLAVGRADNSRLKEIGRRPEGLNRRRETAQGGAEAGGEVLHIGAAGDRAVRVVVEVGQVGARSGRASEC